VRGDRFVLRDAGAQRSIGGGRVLDIFPPDAPQAHPGATGAARRAAGRRSRGEPEADGGAAVAGVDLDRFAANWNLTADAAAALWRAGLRVVFAGTQQLGFTAEVWQALGEKLLAALAQNTNAHPTWSASSANACAA
jgi:selenocysteine-specific elongation factor